MMRLFKLLGTGVLALVFVTFLVGCNTSDSNIEGNNEDLNVELSQGMPPMIVGVSVEYYDKDKTGYLLLKSEELEIIQKDSMFVEILSYKDELTGLSFWEQQELKVMRNLFCIHAEGFNRYPAQQIELKRHYSIKYKVPSIHAESVEELKLVFHLEHTFSGRFEEAWYNGKKISIISQEEFIKRSYPDFPQVHLDIETLESAIYESYYNGELSAVNSNSFIHSFIS